MSRHNAALSIPNDTPELAPIEHTEAEREHREYPCALTLYAGEIHSGIVKAGMASIDLNNAILSRNLTAMQTAAEIIEAESNRVQVVADLYAKKIAALRKRSPLTRV